ncbi:Lacal_2735 family protein [Winogradskyella marincola]|uniref:Lacal_2735 family protein n=1 Tax=Winogradskyella marincola TaxID=3037795 RepID=A0ABT6G3L7_9FLAO|nr:Lacal_2735 family protein [Winogradskyella sp. YYF002]MDG4716414.1 Lacal_2735 family protein [Winogradskyella sp. YYF002]
MKNSERLIRKRFKLRQQYLRLIEDAYNLRETDHALSDFSEFKATKVLNQLNKLKFIIDDTNIQAN